MATLLDLFPTPNNLLALEPEELAGILIEIIPSISQRSGFVINSLVDQLYTISGGYPFQSRDQVVLAIGESLNWLIVEGLVIRNPAQMADWHILSRRGQRIKSRADLEAYQKGRMLPVDMLQEPLARKVHHLFLRGDYDTAVFQAFVEVEVAARSAAGYSDEEYGRDLFIKAFNPKDGPLRNPALSIAERESEKFLFAGAYGHARNPVGHRRVDTPPQTAAKLIMLASHLLSIIAERPVK